LNFKSSIYFIGFITIFLNVLLCDFEFTPIREGKYRLRDSEYSGTYFAAMQTDVVVESPEAFQKWLADASNATPVAAYNRASSEYAKRANANNWATVIPAAQPVVNYSN
jgi:cytochrome c oxidase subunit 2